MLYFIFPTFFILFLVCFEPNVLNCLVAGFLWCPLPSDALSTCLCCLRVNPALGGVRVAHLFSFYGGIFASFVCVLCLVYPIMPVFWIVPSIFSNVYFDIYFHDLQIYRSACTSQESELLCICVLGVSMVSLPTILLLDLDLFRQSDILCFSFYYYLLIVKWIIRKRWIMSIMSLIHSPYVTRIFGIVRRRPSITQQYLNTVNSQMN